jgi:predicted nucleic acid-binding protein
MPEIVSNTGPLIALASIDQFDLLHKRFEIVHIPNAVRSEILDQNTLEAVNKADWIVICTTKDEIAVELLKEELDAGESEAIILAREQNADLLLIDDRAARRKAATLELTVMGIRSKSDSPIAHDAVKRA